MRKFFVLSLFFLFSCSPERDNPRDPNSPFYQNKTNLLGKVETRTGLPIPDCEIIVRQLAEDKNNRIEGKTNQSGRYEIRDCPAENILVVARKEGFVPESVFSHPQVYKSETINFVLEGLPKFLSLSVSSQFCARYIPRDSSVLNLKAEVKDGEGQGDIKRVFAIIEGLSDTIPLLFRSGFLYQNSFPEESLSVTLDEIIGRGIYILAEDIFSHFVSSPRLSLIRVIRTPPEPISPIGGDSVSSYPLLHWSLPQYRFSYSQFLEIYLIRPNLEPVLYSRYENLLPDKDSLSISDSLIPGFYYWQIGVRDSYNNWAKSAEAVFRVGTAKRL